MALAYTDIHVEIREISLRDRPEELYQASKKGTVPVLITLDGLVIDESLEIILWSLKSNSKQIWLSDNSDLEMNLINQNDTIFKKWYGWYFYRCNGKWTLDPTHVREYTKESQLIEKLVSAGLKISMESKVQDGRPVMDSILRRIGAPRDIYNNKFLKALRSVRVPIPGYYIWEIVCYRPST